MDKNCFFKGVLTGRALKARNMGANAAGSNVVLSPVSALNYDKSNFLAGLSVGMGLKGWADRGNAFGGDYSGTAPELGYAWCLGKAVPVYNRYGLVDNPQYARFYVSELPAFSAADYPYITVESIINWRLLRFRERDFLSLMNRGTFITKTGFPCMAMLHRTDAPMTTPYGFNWIGAGDNRAYAICNYADNARYAPNDIEYFDFYLNYNYDKLVKSAIRYNGEKNRWYFLSGGGPIRATRDNYSWLRPTNIGEYLVLTKTPNGIIMD